MKPTLQFRLSQHLTLTPQLQQAIRLLQLSTVELNQEIERLLADNPALERADAEAEDDTAGARAPLDGAARGGEAQARSGTEELPPEYGAAWPRPEGDEDDGRGFSLPDTPTLRDHLNEQLRLTNLSARDRVLAGLLIDALDEDGYLTQSLEEIAALLPPEAEVGVDDLAIALRHLQNLEPVGVGARTPSECLALQLQARDVDDATSRLALLIAEHHLELLAAHDYVRLRAATGAPDDALRAAQQLIRSLNPRPGAEFARLEARYVIPDVIVRKVKGAWRTVLNPEAMPKLRIHRLYAELAAGRANGGAALGAQLQEARWLIKNVQQRFDTILRVAQAIVERQRHFLEHGDVAMRPMVLREIAAVLGLHESTISRVTTQKYMATPRGTYELKYFFGSHVATDSGGAASGKAIRALIRQLVAAENARLPLSDARISQILAQQGIVVARRTVAKYRESLQIPPANQRKSL
ncbi:MAG: RNA polymerase factor sigma-54 [Betaproteobacteria bacterium RIFCSPLOWO2_02_FULL_67_19]|nr:MAG: RNA polymerase factor sigma-54 [Betaproteobacteria bacterium RIFCSPLOWO2_02_FULL_67_19]